MDNQESKYFTPDISDIRVGYELEISYLHEDNFTPIKLRYPAETSAFLLEVYNRKIRVPYLTKEQIEGEGWSEKSPEILPHGFFLKEQYKLELLTDNLILIRKNGWYPENTVYKGLCKDINTFRYIMKLLNI